MENFIKDYKLFDTKKLFFHAVMHSIDGFNLINGLNKIFFEIYKEDFFNYVKFIQSFNLIIYYQKSKIIDMWSRNICLVDYRTIMKNNFKLYCKYLNRSEIDI